MGEADNKKRSLEGNVEALRKECEELKEAEAAKAEEMRLMCDNKMANYVKTIPNKWPNYESSSKKPCLLAKCQPLNSPVQVDQSRWEMQMVKLLVEMVKLLPRPIIVIVCACELPLKIAVAVAVPVHFQATEMFFWKGPCSLLQS